MSSAGREATKAGIYTGIILAVTAVTAVAGAFNPRSAPRHPRTPAPHRRRVESPQPKPEPQLAIVKDIASSPVSDVTACGTSSHGCRGGTHLAVGIHVRRPRDLHRYLVISVVAIFSSRAADAILHTLGAFGRSGPAADLGFIPLAIAVALVATRISALLGIPIYTD